MGERLGLDLDEALLQGGKEEGEGGREKECVRERERARRRNSWVVGEGERGRGEGRFFSAPGLRGPTRGDCKGSIRGL